MMELKRISITTILTFVIVSVMSTFIFAETMPDKNISIPNESNIEKLLTINIGNGDQEVAYSPQIEGIANDGPSSFAVGDEGNIYILDTLNKKILVYRNLNWDSNIDISFCSYPRDIVIKGSSLFILDDSNLIYEVDNKGTIKSIKKLPAKLEACQINKISIDNVGNIVADSGGVKYEINDDGYSKKNEISLVTKNNGKEIDIVRGAQVYSTISFIEETGGVNVIKEDAHGNMFVEVIDEVPDSPLVLLESTVRMIDNSGKQIGFARIPIEDYSNYPLRFFNVTNNDELYIMALKRDSVEIDKIVLGKKYASKMSELKVKAKEEKEKLNKIVIESLLGSDPGIPTRSEIKARADAMVNLSWTYTAANRSNPNSTNVTMPPYLSSITTFPSYQTKIPYCWGGFDGVDRSSSTSWTNFNDAISKSKFAGNTNTNTSGWQSGTTGLDCSGFVSAAILSTTKHNTTYFATAGTATSTPLSMDYYVKSGSHILFYTGAQDTTTIKSEEATTSGSPQATKNYTRTKTWLSTNGYILRTLW